MKSKLSIYLMPGGLCLSSGEFAPCMLLKPIGVVGPLFDILEATFDTAYHELGVGSFIKFYLLY